MERRFDVITPAGEVEYSSNHTSDVLNTPHGTISAGSDGYVLYTPNAGFQGLDSFTYNWSYDAKDEDGVPVGGPRLTTNTATFSIQVGNWIDLLPATTYDNDVHKSILGVGQSETTTLVLQNPRGDGVPAFGFWLGSSLTAL